MTRSILLPLCALSGTLVATSCSSLTTTADKVGEFSRDSVAKVSESVSEGVSNLLPSRVPVVEVREKDLKEMPLGDERALAYRKQRERSFWFFSGPVDFEEPDLPDEGELDLSTGLLPPKTN